MASEHYFTARPSSEMELRDLNVVLAGHELTLTTAAGVFSPDRIDTGTSALLQRVPAPPFTGNILDLGCGWGPIALTAALRSPGATVWAVDVNARALELLRNNAAKYDMRNINAVHPDDVPETTRFDAIWSNPPIRIGKTELHALLRHWLPLLTPRGTAWLVVARKLGADSLQRWLEAELPGAEISRTATEKGYRILRVAAG